MGVVLQGLCSEARNSAEAEGLSGGTPDIVG